MLTSYAQGKADEFNAAVAKYQRLLAASQPEGVDLQKIRFEAFFNQLESLHALHGTLHLRLRRAPPSAGWDGTSPYDGLAAG